MAFRLVIAEKPSMAQTIAAALGIKGKQDGYIEGGGGTLSLSPFSVPLLTRQQSHSEP